MSTSSDLQSAFFQERKRGAFYIEHFKKRSVVLSLRPVSAFVKRQGEGVFRRTRLPLFPFAQRLQAKESSPAFEKFLQALPEGTPAVLKRHSHHVNFKLLQVLQHAPALELAQNDDFKLVFLFANMSHVLLVPPEGELAFARACLSQKPRKALAQLGAADSKAALRLFRRLALMYTDLTIGRFFAGPLITSR